MSKHSAYGSYGHGYGRGQMSPVVGRSEASTDDERPLAEIRKMINDVLRILTLHRWAFFVPFCLIASTVYILSLSYPRTYTASASFQRRDDPIVHNLPTNEGTGSFTYFRSTMNQDIKSVATLSEAADLLGLTADLPRDEDGNLTEEGARRRERIGQNLAANVSVSAASPSEHIDLVTVHYVGPDKNLAKPLVETIRQAYIRQTLERVGEFLGTQREYFSGRAEEAHAELQEAKRAETRLRLDNPNVDPRDPGAITLKLAQLEIERRDLQLRRRMLEADLAARRQMLAALEPDVQFVLASERATPGLPIPAPTLSPRALALMGQIEGLDAEVRQLQSSRGMTLEHPHIAKLLEKRRLLDEQLTLATNRTAPFGETLDNAEVVANAALDSNAPPLPTPSVRPATSAWSAEQAQMKVQISTLEAQLKDIDISLESNKSAVALMEQARHDVFDKQEEFSAVAAAVDAADARYQQVQMTLAALEPGIKALEQNRLLQFTQERSASASAAPIAPQTATVMFLALLVGAVAGGFFVVLAELFDHAFRSSNRVSRSLGIPILESIDEIVTACDRRKKLIRQAVVVPIVLVCGLGTVGVTGSLAYCSLARPWTYDRLRGVPEAAVTFLTGDQADEQASTPAETNEP